MRLWDIRRSLTSTSGDRSPYIPPFILQIAQGTPLASLEGVSQSRLSGRPHERGFSLIEVLLVIGVMGVIAVMVLPQNGRTAAAVRLKTDGRNIANMISLTKMRAASAFSRARLHVNTATNQYSVQVRNKDTGAWQTEGATYRTSPGVTFGYGSLPSPPPDTQPTIHQSPACRNDADDADLANTACIVFNSRGIPIDSSLAAYGENAIYLTDGVGVYVTTITATPLVRRWWSPATVAAWVKQ